MSFLNFRAEKGVSVVLGRWLTLLLWACGEMRHCGMSLWLASCLSCGKSINQWDLRSGWAPSCQYHECHDINIHMGLQRGFLRGVISRCCSTPHPHPHIHLNHSLVCPGLASCVWTLTIPRFCCCALLIYVTILHVKLSGEIVTGKEKDKTHKPLHQ